MALSDKDYIHRLTAVDPGLTTCHVASVDVDKDGNVTAAAVFKDGTETTFGIPKGPRPVRSLNVDYDGDACHGTGHQPREDLAVGWMDTNLYATRLLLTYAMLVSRYHEENTKRRPSRDKYLTKLMRYHNRAK
jgi:hypothetical protein